MRSLGWCVVFGLLVGCGGGVEEDGGGGSVEGGVKGALEAYSDEPYAVVLSAVVKGEDGLVDYGALAADAGLRQKLDVYLDAVARFGPERTPDAFATADDELAYYINAYNATMLRVWLDHGAAEAELGTEVDLSWFGTERFVVDGVEMTLDGLGKDVIGKRYPVPGNHYALVCGGASCPPLLDEPYVGERLREQMAGVADRWLNRPDGLRVREVDGQTVAEMSQVFEWYRGDFESVGGLRGVVARHAQEPLRSAALSAIDADRLGFYEYDWSINSVE